MGLLFDAAMAWDKLSNATYDIDVAKNRKVHHIKLSFLTESWLVKNIWKTDRDNQPGDYIGQWIWYSLIWLQKGSRILQNQSWLHNPG